MRNIFLGGLLSVATIIATLIAITDFVGAMPPNTYFGYLGLWNPARLTRAGVAAGFAVMFIAAIAIMQDLDRLHDRPTVRERP